MVVQWLTADYADRFDAQGKGMIDLLTSQVRHMDGLITGILKYSRAGYVIDAPEPIPLDLLVRNVINMLTPPENIEIIIAGHCQPSVPKSDCQCHQCCGQVWRHDSNCGAGR